MAALDPLLRALREHGMDALLLSPGRLPRLRRGETEREVTRQPLDGERILRLLAEIAPPDALPPLEPGATWRFRYRLGDEGFELRGEAGESGWEVEARPVSEDRAGGSRATGGRAGAAAGGRIASLEAILRELLERGASDLHLSAGQVPRMRIDGDMVELPGLGPLGEEEVSELIRPAMPERNVAEFAASNDTDFAHELPGEARFRVNLFRDRGGASAVLRTIPADIPSFDEIDLPDTLRRLTDLSKGLVLVTGPTGSGKSTTLAALIDLINRNRHEHLITIEDPIEFVHPSRGCLVNQREVGVHTKSFKSALRAALREDPDILLVGEMRDLETVSIAIETAETGHLVFGTLHTTTAASTVERLVDQFPGDRQGQIRMMLADSLRAVVAQQLLRRKGGGRVAAFEILICTPAVSNLIREGKTFQIASAMQTGRRLGMRLLTDSLMELVESDTVEAEEAYLKAADKEAILNRLRAAGHDVRPAETP